MKDTLNVPVLFLSGLNPFMEEMLSETILKRLVTQDVIHAIKPKKDSTKSDSANLIYVQVSWRKSK